MEVLQYKSVNTRNYNLRMNIVKDSSLPNGFPPATISLVKQIASNHIVQEQIP
jgi:hypothetical protein